MKNVRLFAGVAVMALLTGTPSAFADPVNLTIDNVNQNTSNKANVTNNGAIKQEGVVSGNGASLSISAAGAVSSASVSSINAPEFNSISIGTNSKAGNLQQITSNTGIVANTQPTFGKGMEPNGISGDGASVSVSATGSASAVSVSRINNSDAHQNAGIEFGGINQTTYNGGTIQNNGGTISTDKISGNGASASIEANGAVSSVSISSIVDEQQLGKITFARDINQNTANSANVANIGVIQTGALTGQGASVSVSAIGAASAVSFSTIK